MQMNLTLQIIIRCKYSKQTFALSLNHNHCTVNFMLLCYTWAMGTTKHLKSGIKIDQIV